MDRNRAHDVIHIWNGNKTENCPVCKGEMTTDEEILACAKDIAAQNYYPRINPSMESEAIWCDDKEKPADAPEEVKAGEDTKPTAVEEPKEIVPAPTRHIKMSEMYSIMVDAMSFSDDKKSVPSRIKIIPTGKFNTPKYGELEINKEQLLEMVNNFKSDVRAFSSQTGLPIDIEHGETQYRDAAAGWMRDIVVMDDGAYADVEWTPLGRDLLEKGIYKFFSPEFTFEYVTNEQSVEFSNVAIGGGLVNKPLFDHSLYPLTMSEDGKAENLTTNHAPHMLYISNSKQSSAEVSTNSESESLQASEKDKPMELQTILAKGKSERTSDEQKFVYENFAQLTEEQKAAEMKAEEAPAEVVAQEQPVVEAAPVEVAAPDENAPAKGDAAIAASEKANNVTISASELDTLKAEAAKGALAFKELDKKQVTDTVRKYQFNEKGGKFAPAQGDQLIDIMLTMGEKDRAKLVAFVEGLPERGQMLFEEKGSDEDLSKSQAKDVLAAKINEKRDELMKANPSLAFADATRQASLSVVAENPQLYKDSKQAVKAY